MKAIKINVNKQMDGYTFSISPSIREQIKELIPNAHPANNIYIAYDTKSNFELYIDNIESHIFPVLLGIANKDLKKIEQIELVDTQTGHTHKVNPSFDKEI